MWWLLPYLSLFINLVIIRFMPKHLTNKEIYISWFVVALINLSSDIVLSLYFRLYELNGDGVQLSVHIIELTLGASYGIIFLNFMPKAMKRFIVYCVYWLIFSLIFESLLVYTDFIHYFEWNIWYSALYYLAAFFFIRWHLYFIRSGN
ncbi:hypothetical protein [Metabacillus halosaccharovorans]|uniref:hypothetical protein n=1 Tax=Metabacillus halosaccharovorans TaxID=930124 RepID=UPI001C20107F|nr:hypothetical protein [Metabacillus halosaccharovorans]